MYTPEKSQNEVFAENLMTLLHEKGWSQNELARKLNMSPTNVNKWCRGLVTPRPDAVEAMCQLFNVKREELLNEQKTVPNLSVPAAYPVPILGEICAGDGIIAEENFRGYFFVDHSIRADYCLEVEGDSMKDANIHHGDIAFLRKTFDFLNGGIYAVVYGLDNNAMLKRVYKQGDNLLLMPCNQKYNPISVEASEAFICGELVGVYSPRSNR